MKKLRLFPIIVSVIVSSSVLFGGWFVYRTVALENPLSDKVEQIEAVASLEGIELSGDVAVVKVELKPDADLLAVTKEIREAAGDRELQLEVTNDSGDRLEHWWSLLLFDVAEAMETKQYSDIPETLEARSGELSGLTYTTQMDKENVYIRLNAGDDVKFVTLPRIPAQMGVFGGE